MRRILPFAALGLAGFALLPRPAESACCYFSAKDADILQPAQKCFLTYDPATKVEAFTVQPKFEGNAVDFGMVIPTPSRPKLDPMPRDFFKHLAVFTILKKREHPKSKLLPEPKMEFRMARGGAAPPPGAAVDRAARAPAVKVLESGVVGSLDYKIIEAGRADDLFNWLKDNRYSYAGDEATLDFYVKKQWLFTVMKIDTAQMKKNADGTYAGEVTPTRFQFRSDEFVYPLKITQLSVKDKTEALIYVQTGYKCDLPGDDTFQFQWVPMIQNARGWYAKGIFGSNDLPGKADDWLTAIGPQVPALLQKGQQLGFDFVSGRRPTPNAQGRTPTTFEWGRKLSADDMALLKGEAAFGERLPNPDEGFTRADVDDAAKRETTYATIRERLDRFRKERPGGYLVREAPPADVAALKQLLGHLTEGQYVTKLRKVFTKGEMNDDLRIVPAKLGDAVDSSEYTEILPTSPP